MEQRQSYRARFNLGIGLYDCSPPRALHDMKPVLTSQRPVQVAWAVALLALEQCFQTGIYLYGFASFGPLREALEYRWFYLPMALFWVVTLVVVTCLLARKNWARYAVLALCLLSLPDLLSFSPAGDNSDWFYLYRFSAWLGFVPLLGAAALLFTSPSRAWFRNAPTHARTIV